MAKYILNGNKQDSPSGSNYEVHDITPEACGHLPHMTNQYVLGECTDCHEAINKAKSMFPAFRLDIDGCYYCCNECHSE